MRLKQIRFHLMHLSWDFMTLLGGGRTKLQTGSFHIHVDIDLGKILLEYFKNVICITIEKRIGTKNNSNFKFQNYIYKNYFNNKVLLMYKKTNNKYLKYQIQI